MYFLPPLGTEDRQNSEFLLFSSYRSFFSLQDDIFIYYKVEMFQKFSYEQTCKNSI